MDIKFKSINQIFKNNSSLKDDIEVAELIKYCKELEGKIYENEQSKKFSFEDKLSEVVRDIYLSCTDLEQEEKNYDRWPNDFNEPNHKKIVKHLKKYILNFSIDNNFRL